MRLGISSHTYAWGIGVAGYSRPAQPLNAFQLVRKAARLKVPVLQIADNLPLHRMSNAERRDLKQFADESCVDVEVGTAGIDRERLLTYLEIAREFGSPILRTLLDADGGKPSFDECVTRMQDVIREFERAGICLAVENHDRFRSGLLAQLMTAVGSPQFGICLDMANSLGCGEDIDTVLRNLAPFVVNLHIKDFQVTRLPHQKGFSVEGAPAGQGCLNVPAILGSLRDRPASMTAIVELWLSPDADLEQTIQREDRWAIASVDFVRRHVS
ncbi:MAG TPA: TIM barrel protein [Caulifigura sp.]|jgi:sugar phosphate isomerase/epimerase|nr:TIM barrel protein [Caulifigura sp.]